LFSTRILVQERVSKEDFVQLLFYSIVVSIVILIFLLAFQRKTGLLFSFSFRQYLRSIWLGFLNPFLYYAMLFKAYDLLPAQEAQALNYTWAIALGLLSIPLLKQKLRLRDMVATFVSYFGVLVISTHGAPFSLSFSESLGVGLALSSTVIWSLYWIYNIKDDRDPVAGLLLNFVFGLPFVLTACLVFSSVWIPDPYTFIGPVYVGLFEMGITYVLWLSALRLSESTSRVGNLIFLSPFVSLVFIHFLVGEEILASTFVGLVIIVSGLLLQQFKARHV
jgi:drug/metabolite transporter (DMT)-like permease